MYDRQALIDAFRARAIRFGDFTLASGRKSSYYVDKMQITLHGPSLRLAASGLLDLLKDVEFTAIGGMVIGADPIVGSVISLAAESGRQLNGFLVRKEPKSHGTQQFIEGPLKPGDHVVIVEDVVTTAGSALQAFERVRNFGCHVALVVTIVDRLEGGAQAFAEKGIPFLALLTIKDFGITPPTNA